MASNLAGDLSSEWWDSLAGEEPEPCDSPRSQVLQDWSWANQQVEDCFALTAVGFPDGDARVDNQCPLSDLVSGGLEDVLMTPDFPSVVQGSPHRSVFKTSYVDRLPEQPVPLPGKDGYIHSPGVSTPDGSTSKSVSTEVVLDLATDEHSDTVTCNITSNRGARSSSKDCGATQVPLAADPALTLAGAGVKDELREHEGDSCNPVAGLPHEVDLRCKGERLGYECEEDSSVNVGMNWSHAPGKSMGFIPVSNSILPATSSLSTDGPSTSPARGSESADDTEGASSRQLDGSSKQRPFDQSDESPADSRDSGLSEGTTISGPEDGKQRKLGKLTDAASATDITAPGVLNRKRPGRPAKLTAAASEAKATTKRKRATTSKPAAPAVSGQACTQCFTHVTPVWRAGPEGPKTLCNACGVRYMKVVKRK